MIHTPHCVIGTFLHESQTDWGCEGRWMSLACCTSFPVGPGKSIQRLHRDATSSIHVGPEAGARSTVITILHVTLSAHPMKEKRGGEGSEEEEDEEERRANERWQRRRMEENELRMWTLTALQYTQGHDVYKPPQFYLHPSSTSYNSCRWD